MLGFVQTLSGTRLHSRCCVGPMAACGRAAAVALALILSIIHVAPAHGQQPTAAPPAAADAAASLNGPGLVPNGGLSTSNANAGVAQTATGVHPLQPALDLAQQGLVKINANIRDYSCTIVKRERIDGKLGEHEYMFAKIRSQPFSVYLYFLGPDSVKGQEVIYVAGHNDGNMLAHAGSGVRAMVGTVSLKPQSMLAMQGNRYPVTEIGVENLAKRLVEVAEHDKQFG